MAANTIEWGETRAPIHIGEKLLTPGYATDIELTIPATIEGPKRTEKSWGRIWLTDQRIIFIAVKRPGGEDLNAPHRVAGAPGLHSLIIPYDTIKDTSFHLPIFSANHQLIQFIPDLAHPAPNLPNPGSNSALVCKLLLAEGLGHNMYKRIEKERETWLKRLRDGETLPAYTPREAPPPPLATD
ncbi:hypothetical protein CcaverHIS002_0605050 [Cutaneotrichosporon cavernicola]|uniref:Uncharacterized protein n=1 Tax=Cutaneotrichosporon cavernicola TaxID=279322 RepID=A0AA48QY58_9TREE|nr:uncharacterized protein CcaverHIS019_0604490 [Cutaneotrichosporon cavernicola]BEI86218.1 hypothetical protein CcaverHIS002_0605050 [Cutaneotrichosporon cavernicola]BEI93990.1 hypothetical protein CcaverHIS019_0604490 [Cutaneotrichosporon cavernicola]BEJ01771.1 hypothetical protein CcaverHIS631_0604530 [Cutaneotrichosporon cavernicola]BEJ09538.1 hypothetical protein CcaverHIS641_0604530 [Cutaneotrichosporon cavernicola]